MSLSWSQLALVSTALTTCYVGLPGAHVKVAKTGFVMLVGVLLRCFTPEWFALAHGVEYGRVPRRHLPAGRLRRA